MTTIQPCGRWVLVQLDEPERFTPGGLAIPDDAQREPEWGTVIACGPGGKRRTSKQEKRKTGADYVFVGMDVRPGQRVFCGAFNGWEVPRSRSGGKYQRMMDVERDIYLVEDECATT